MKAWLRLHWMAFSSALKKLAASPFATLLNVLVIGVALALPAGGYLLLTNLKAASKGVSSEPEVSLFMMLEAQKADVDLVRKRLSEDSRIAEVRYKSRETALAELKANPAFADVLATLKDNPLPDAFVAVLKENNAAQLEEVAKTLRTYPKVEHVQIDSAWVRRVAAALDIGRIGVLVLAALLSFALLAVTFNTIRLQILTQRDEIEISKLLGATDGTIRRPHYYYGALLGFLGGGTAMLMLTGALSALNRAVADFATLYASDYRLSHLPPGDITAILLFAAALGWLGSWLSTARHLREFEPA
jgi:cell division transport system permease protein